MTADFLPPRQTGRADFPHPAFAMRLRRVVHRLWRFGARPQLRSRPTHFLLSWDFSNQQRWFLRSPRMAKAPSLHGRYPASSLLEGRQGPLPRLTGLSDSLVIDVRLMDSASALPRTSRGRRQGSPSLPNSTFPARCPLSPRRTPPLFVNIASRRVSGFSISGGLAVLTLCNEAESGSLALRLAGSIHGASTTQLLPSLSASLHAGYSVGMMNTFQFIGFVGGAGAPEDTENACECRNETMTNDIIAAISQLWRDHCDWNWRTAGIT